MNHDVEAIELLEKAKESNNYILEALKIHAHVLISDVECTDSFIKQALTLLKQQPPAGEFTESTRKIIEAEQESAIEFFDNPINPEKIEGQALSFADATKVLCSILTIACDRLDRAQAIITDLKTACKYTKTLLSKGIGQNTHALSLIETAIAGAKKG